MKKMIFICISALMLFGCSSKNCPKPAKAAGLQKIEVYEYGLKRTYYIDPAEKAVKTTHGFAIKTDASDGLPVLYASQNKKSRYIATNRFIIKVPAQEKTATIEQEYGLKLIRPLNKRIGLYLFEAPEGSDLFKLARQLNLAGIKAKIDYYAPYKLY